MIDTHIHLESKEYDADRQNVIKRFFQNGGRAIINIGVDQESMKKTLEIAKFEERIFVAVGFHPQAGTDMEISNSKFKISNNNKKTNSKFQNAISFLEKTIKNDKNKIVAIGEIGLDYFHPSAVDFELKIDDEIKKIQKELFIKQLNLAKKLNLPVIIHSWEAQDDCWEILKKYPDLRVVFHCYGRGIDPGFTKKLLEHKNIWFSFTGNITFPQLGKAGAEIFEHLKLIPMERIMIETDGPFLAPVPHRGKRNEPIYIKHIIEKISQVKNSNKQEIEIQTDKNAIIFFGLENKGIK